MLRRIKRCLTTVTPQTDLKDRLIHVRSKYRSLDKVVQKEVGTRESKGMRENANFHVNDWELN